MKILAIIPARAGSKGFPGKNLALLGGKPLIAWSIEQALSSPSVDRVVVSTDGQEIAAVARQYGAEVPFMRPADIATDQATTESAMEHAVTVVGGAGYRPDFVMLLQPTCPIRKRGAVESAVRTMVDAGADSLVSACEIHPFIWQSPGDARALYDFRNRPRRQDVAQDDRLYEENGSIYITRTEILMRDHCRLGGRIAIFPMSSIEGIDIDTADDLALAEAALCIAGDA